MGAKEQSGRTWPSIFWARGTTGSTCFWASRIRIHESEVWIRILVSSSKNSKINFYSYYLWLLLDFLSLKNDVNVSSKSNKQKNVNDENSRIRIQNPDPDPNPDPLVRGMVPRIRIHKSEAWFRGSESRTLEQTKGWLGTYTTDPQCESFEFFSTNVCFRKR